MTLLDPAARPTASEVLEKWNKMSKPGRFGRVLRLRPREEPAPISAIIGFFDRLGAIPTLFS